MNGIRTHFAFRLPGEGHPVVPGGPESFSCLKAPHKSGFDAGRMGGFSRSPRLVTLAEAIDVVGEADQRPNQRQPASMRTVLVAVATSKLASKRFGET